MKKWNFVLFLRGRELVFYVGIQDVGVLEKLHLSSDEFFGTHRRTYFASESVKIDILPCQMSTNTNKFHLGCFYCSLM